ncbi:MAG: phospholipid carrier-dependent glycosyltransferase [Candidatus Electrothrix sp. EH2]|nr:phospholipid carrier-dependent glycosyltransferase [Candidatus Electrothrix sp. EH2]
MSSTMISNAKKINLIYLLITSFFLFKLIHLPIPYFWDELGVYSRAALYLFDHGISLLPDAMPPELSRGHPLLCSVFFALGYKLFGPQVWGGHLTALLLSCALLYLLYRFTRDFFDHKTALLSSVLLAVQPIFIAQSSMVLPEVMLTFFCTASLYAYLRGRFIQLALFSTLAILTKETAIILPCCLGPPVILTMLRNGINRKRLAEFFLVCTPLFAWGLFLLIQKIRNGWFFFPLHTGYISFSRADISARLGYYLSFLFKGQGRYVWTFLILAASLLFFFKKRRRLVSGSLINEFLTEQDWRPMRILTLYIVVSLAVSALNFHLARYILLLLPVLCLFLAAQLVYFIENINKPVRKYLLLPFLLIPLFYYRGRIFNVDADMGYLEIVEAQQEITARLDEIAGKDAVVAADFPVVHGLIDRRAGYSSREYNVVSCGKEAALAEYLVFSNFDHCRPDEKQYTPLKEVKSSLTMMYLYKNTEKSEQIPETKRKKNV